MAGPSSGSLHFEGMGSSQPVRPNSNSTTASVGQSRVQKSSDKLALIDERNDRDGWKNIQQQGQYVANIREIFIT
jgi:hypothetical protein